MSHDQIHLWAPRTWYEKFTSKLLDLGFLLSASDPSPSIRKGNGRITYLLLYVDDIIITGIDSVFFNKIITQVCFLTFEMKDFRPLTYFLGVKVHRNKSGLCFSQVKYITNLLIKSDIVGCKQIGSLASKSMLSPSNGSPLDDPTAYRSLVGALQYVTLTQPDICFAIN